VLCRTLKAENQLPFEITIAREFSASHQLRLYDGSLEPLHSHDWRVKVTVGAEKLDSIGVVMDFHKLERLVDQVLQPMHNRRLNDLPGFASLNPSAENVAREIAQSLHLPGHVTLLNVEAWETPTCRARWSVNR
jgi:6-pyruvoyltetrahydropterin/6-carboxytetrahydropterin synthase